MFDDLEKFIKFEWSEDCPEILIVEKDTGQELLSASGTIFQNRNGELEMKAYTKEGLTFSDLFKSYSRPGELIEADKYKITFKPYSGTEWEAPADTFFGGSGFHGGIVRARLRKISQITHYSTSENFLSLLFSPIDEFPAAKMSLTKKLSGGKYISSHSLNEVDLKIGKFKFNIVKDGELLRVNCSQTKGSQNEITDGLSWKIQETLQFILGKKLKIITSELVSKDLQVTKFYSSNKKIDERFFPPLRLHDAVIYPDYWKLFESYFDKCREEKGDGFHKLSQYLSSVLDSSKATLEGQCLTLAVAIEGLINTFFKDMPVNKEFSKEDVEKIQHKLMEIEDLSESKQKRVFGLVNILNQIRAKDKLLELVGQGQIEENLVTAWDEVRNKAAHGTLQCDDFQLYYIYKNCMVVLLYKLIFVVIKYSGKYTDYSETGFPIREFTNS